MSGRSARGTTKCLVRECDRLNRCVGLCDGHYRRILRHGDPMLGRRSPRVHGRTHGMSKLKEHGIWSAMINRCHNPNDRHYAEYGGRGIKVCDRWRNDFVAFYEDMGPRPLDLTLDRKDNDGNYEPGNCQWATHRHQVINRRRTRANKSGYVGVSWSKVTKSWAAELRFDGGRFRLRGVKDPLDAAYVRDQAAIQLQGPAALLNVLDERWEDETTGQLYA